MQENKAVDDYQLTSWVSKLQVDYVEEEDGSGLITIEWDETDPELDYWNSLGDEGRKIFMLEALRAAVVEQIPDADVSSFLS